MGVATKNQNGATRLVPRLSGFSFAVRSLRGTKSGP
jgi:hypothetical protein